jgi:hypothetical protein
MNNMNTRVRNKLREHLEDPLAIAEHGLKDIQDIVGRETRVREQLARRGYRLMNRGRRGEYWLMCGKLATLDVLERFVEHIDQRLQTGKQLRPNEPLATVIGVCRIRHFRAKQYQGSTLPSSRRG